MQIVSGFGPIRYLTTYIIPHLFVTKCKPTPRYIYNVIIYYNRPTSQIASFIMLDCVCNFQKADMAAGIQSQMTQHKLLTLLFQELIHNNYCNRLIEFDWMFT